MMVPRVAACVRLHARRRPAHVAVLRGDAPVTYAALDRDLAAMAEALAGFGLAPGQVAAISHRDPYIQLLLIFAFDGLGVATASFRPDEGPECNPLLAATDLVVAMRVPEGAVCRRLFLITDDWLAAALAGPAPRRDLAWAAGGEPLVMFRSSGTTGAPKRMMLTHAMMVARLRRQRQLPLGLGLHARARFLATMHFSVGSMYMGASNCLALGATFCIHGHRNVAPALKARPTHVTMLPYQLRGLLEELPEPAGGPLLPGLTVQTIGAKLPPELRARALARLCGRVVNNYGANETGAIGALDAAGVLHVTPGVTLEVTGPDGAPAPPGEVGTVRVRGDCLVSGYIGDAAATGLMFRDGWFHTGDLALRDDTGALRLVGRRVDVLNLGGIKIPSADLESRLLGRHGVRDVAVVQRNDDARSPPLTICVVGERREFPTLAKTIRALIDFPFALRQVAAIPRTSEGKIKRLELREALFGKAVNLPGNTQQAVLSNQLPARVHIT